MYYWIFCSVFSYLIILCLYSSYTFNEYLWFFFIFYVKYPIGTWLLSNINVRIYYLDQSTVPMLFISKIIFSFKFLMTKIKFQLIVFIFFLINKIKLIINWFTLMYILNTTVYIILYFIAHKWMLFFLIF